MRSVAGVLAQAEALFMASNNLRVRTALTTDIPRLVELNSAAYPDLVEDGVVFDAAQLRAQQVVFPEGQIVVEREAPTREVVGAIATLIVPEGEAMGPHTWAGITSYGTFACHEPRGDVLYLADVYSDPNVAGTGVGAALYDALFRLCERKNLARVVAGGRLWGYHEVSSVMSPETYADEVIDGKRRDRVFGSQLKAGFSYRGILPGYLDDWRSAAFATLLVWENVKRSSTGLRPTDQIPLSIVDLPRRDRLS
jgi:GNAT superfamily N-acetyltransferase